MRAGGGAAILLGAAVGATAALALRENASVPPPAPSSASAAPRRPLGAASQSANSAENTPTAAPQPSAPPLAPSAVAVSPASASPTSASPASASPTSSSPPFPFAAPLPPVTTAAELERAEVRCYEVTPEECGVAADAYDAGVLVRRDAEHAARLRKVELTRLVRACEDRSPHACLVLAGRYASGQGVPENDKRAEGLLEHARDLCQRGVKKAECSGPEPK